MSQHDPKNRESLFTFRQNSADFYSIWRFFWQNFRAIWKLFFIRNLLGQPVLWGWWSMVSNIQVVRQRIHQCNPWKSSNYLRSNHILIALQIQFWFQSCIQKSLCFHARFGNFGFYQYCNCVWIVCIRAWCNNRLMIIHLWC